MALSENAELLMENAQYQAWVDAGDVVVVESGKLKELARVPIDADRQHSALDEFLALAVEAAHRRVVSVATDAASGDE